MHPKSLQVFALSRDVPAESLAGRAVVVIDLLRASTTICTALAAGAADVIPCLEVADALAAAATLDRSQVLLGGERGGKRIEGFDLGNSPAEYTRDRIAGRRVLITTTNGTRALAHARAAGRVVVGAFVNLSAVVASLRKEVDVTILCAGTDGDETREDILAAGAMVDRLLADDQWQLNDIAQRAQHEWRVVLQAAEAAGRSPSEQLTLEFRTAPGGTNLLAIGMEHDLADCAQIDTLSVVPELDVSAWRIALR